MKLKVAADKVHVIILNIPFDVLLNQEPEQTLMDEASGEDRS